MGTMIHSKNTKVPTLTSFPKMASITRLPLTNIICDTTVIRMGATQRAQAYSDILSSNGDIGIEMSLIA
jgi:hypothetical protein